MLNFIKRLYGHTHSSSQEALMTNEDRESGDTTERGSTVTGNPSEICTDITQSLAFHAGHLAAGAAISLPGFTFINHDQKELTQAVIYAENIKWLFGSFALSGAMPLCIHYFYYRAKQQTHQGLFTDASCRHLVATELYHHCITMIGGYLLFSILFPLLSDNLHHLQSHIWLSLGTAFFTLSGLLIIDAISHFFLIDKPKETALPVAIFAVPTIILGALYPSVDIYKHLSLERSSSYYAYSFISLFTTVAALICQRFRAIKLNTATDSPEQSNELTQGNHLPQNPKALLGYAISGMSAISNSLTLLLHLSSGILDNADRRHEFLVFIYTMQGLDFYLNSINKMLAYHVYRAATPDDLRQQIKQHAMFSFSAVIIGMVLYAIFQIDHHDDAFIKSSLATFVLNTLKKTVLSTFIGRCDFTTTSIATAFEILLKTAVILATDEKARHDTNYFHTNIFADTITIFACATYLYYRHLTSSGINIISVSAMSRASSNIGSRANSFDSYSNTDEERQTRCLCISPAPEAKDSYKNFFLQPCSLFCCKTNQPTSENSKEFNHQ